MLGLGGTVSALSTLVYSPPLLFVWNVSASAPLGLYRVGDAHNLPTGDMVIAWAPAEARSLAAKCGYLPLEVPLVKRIAAATGDAICASGAVVTINGRIAATRLARDARARLLPRWEGCVILHAHEYFLLMPNRWSFDGRYFGITRERDMIGKAKLLWPR
jgi:conjugative transfer signal peptidase TraF